ncbi:DUF2141 domain-containing protein [Mariniflexile aquimaris]|uniref:DUF2141 domain-containing protein n=1 Tax=Mariniflexile aquimaris TaxID=881009 RepID=A0ABW3BSF3_9FLAO
MQSTFKIIFFSLFGILVSHAQQAKGNDVTVTVSNLKSNKGKVFFALYNEESHFLKKELRGEISAIENNTCTITFKDVKNGIYAISLFHDENDNNIMDTNFLGIPKEPYGCSNNARGFMGPPKWADAKFQINNKSINQHIKL